ncbi:uncharacterized protein LOC123970153 [Xyrichtys novacula]|uniref:Uncharacterized protein LOC123970153 n=1 Tax=Xyrichtys novacula TaxID=13765 RepID=A0AAV1ETX5_XYRNO|nr:uncharacterized protein LOC123970153 [Xyrichtys novacula]
MAGLIHISVAVLSLLSVGHSLPVTSCDILTKPIEIQGRDQLLGKWIIVGESTNIPKSNYLTNLFVKNAWFGRCLALRDQITLENNILTGSFFNGSAKLLSTGCPDCLIYFSETKIGDITYTGLQLTSKRTKVSAAELEEFQRQVACLNLTSPAILNQDEDNPFSNIYSTDVCTEDSALTVDLTQDMNDIGSKALAALDKMLNDESFMQKVLSSLFTMFKGEEDN